MIGSSDGGGDWGTIKTEGKGMTYKFNPWWDCVKDDNEEFLLVPLGCS